MSDDIALTFVNSFEPYKGYWKKSEDYSLRLAESILKKRNTRKILDVGCGQGRLFERFSRQFQYVLGVDPDTVRVSRALEEVRRKGYANVEVKVGVIRDIELPENFFDAVFCCHVIQHMHTNKLQPFLKRTNQVLNEHGVLVLFFAHSKCKCDIFRQVFIKNDKIIWNEISEITFNTLIKSSKAKILPVRMFSIENLKQLLKSQFSILSIRVFNEFYPRNLLDNIVFRDHLINLPFLKYLFGGDVMIIAKKI